MLELVKQPRFSAVRSFTVKYLNTRRPARIAHFNHLVGLAYWHKCCFIAGMKKLLLFFLAAISTSNLVAKDSKNLDVTNFSDQLTYQGNEIVLPFRLLDKGPSFDKIDMFAASFDNEIVSNLDLTFEGRGEFRTLKIKIREGSKTGKTRINVLVFDPTKKLKTKIPSVQKHFFVTVLPKDQGTNKESILRTR